MKPQLRVGVVGYGYMGQIRHRNISNNSETNLAAICDPFCPEALADLNVPKYQHWQDLITADLDLVFVCTPNNLIPEVAVHALQNNRHVFCEKPPGRNLADIERIRAAEQDSPQCKLQFGFNHRHHPGIIDGKAVIDSGSLGDILTLRGTYGKSGGYDYHKSWRNDPAIGGGGILLDQGLHMLDLFCLFVGEFSDVMGMRGTLAYDIPVEDNAVVIMKTPRGQLAQLHSSATAWKHTFRLEIGCERGYIVVTGLLSKTGSYGRETLVIGRRPPPGDRSAIGNPREETTYYDIDQSWDIEVSHLVDCIRQNKPVVSGTSSDALRAMKIVDRVYQAESFKRIEG